MMGFSLSSIKRKVLVIAIFPVGLVTLLLTILFSINQTLDLEQSLDDRGLAIVRQLSPASEYGVFTGNQNILQSLIESVSNEADVRSISIRSSSSIELAKFGPDMHPSAEYSLNINKTAIFESNNRKSRIFVAPIFQTEFSSADILDIEILTEHTTTPEFKTTNRIIGWVSVELSLERTHAIKQGTWIESIFVAVIVLLLSGILAIRLGRRITVPITKLKDAVHEVENGNLDIQVDTGTSGELQTLESGINTMAKSLKASRDNMQVKIEQATSNLLDTLRVLEERNNELEEARNEAESANKTKSDFLANISHEIRTPIHGIKGFLMLLSKTTLSSEQFNYIDKIEVSAKTLLTLLNDILDISKLEAGKITITPSDFDIRDLVYESIAVCLPEAQRKDLEIYIIIDSDIPDRLLGGADRIAQIIKNLVSNAVKFTYQGHVVVHVHPENSNDTNNLYSFTVTDTGIGISNEDFKRLFQPFSQLESGIDRSFSGTGLGLAICNSLAELMNGKITVDSTPRVGSSFNFTLPLATQIDTQTSNKSLNTINGKSAIILSEDTHLIHSIFENCKHYNISAEHGSKTYDVIDSLTQNDATYDYVLIDSNYINYETLPDRIKFIKNNRNAYPKFILIKPLQMTGELSNIQNLFDGFIARPIQNKELLNILHQLSTKQTEKTETSFPPAEKVINNLIFNKAATFLLADDNEINRQFLSTWLKQLGALVDEVDNGYDAVQHCLSKQYDSILMDLHMPKMDGMQAANEIRINGIKTPIIVVTADATDKAAQLIQNSAFDDILVKPVSGPELLKAIEKWCPDQFNISADSTNQDETSSIVDKEVGLNLASGNEKLWYWSIRTLAQKLIEQQSDFEHAINSNNREKLQALAHSISGSASYCGAAEITSIAKKLEKLSDSGSVTELTSLSNNLHLATNRLLDWISTQNNIN